MLDEAKLQDLAATQFLNGLEAQELSYLAQFFEKKSFEKSDYIFRNDEVGDSVFFIDTGSVEIYTVNENGQKITHKVALAGDIFGELCIFDERVWKESARALEDVSLYHIPKQKMLDFFANYPRAAFEVLKNLSSKMRAIDNEVKESVVQNVNTLIAKRMSIWEKIAVKIADHSGTLLFIGYNIVFWILWMVFNTWDILPGFPHLDDPPGFDQLQLIAGIESYFISCLVLFSQNRDAKSDNIRNEIEYKINQKSEAAIENLLKDIVDLQQKMNEKFSEAKGVE